MILPPWADARPRVIAAQASGPAAPTDVDAGVERLQGAGADIALRPLPPHRGVESAFLAASDEARARSLLHAICAPGYDAVLSVRGGYGAMRILAALPARVLADRPRWLVGYSDATALHLWAYAQGVASVHGPMLAGFDKHYPPDAPPDGSLESLLDALAGDPHALPCTSDTPGAAISGPLIGGNLSLLAALRPTPWWPSLDGAILVIEEVGEALYRIDRLLETLLLAGGLEQVAAFALGQFTRCGPDDVDAAAHVAARLAPLGRPVLTGLPTGHGTPNLAWIHGHTYAFDGDALTPAPTRAAKDRDPVVVDVVEPVDRLVSRAIACGVSSGLQLVALERGVERVAIAEGFTAFDDQPATRAPVTHDTWFDLASVSKALCTAPLAHLAIERGLVTLDTRCPADISVATPTLADLLRHTSGLPAYEPVWHEARASDGPAAFARRAFTALDATGPPGREVYSDVGYIALGRWLARLFDAPLDNRFAKFFAGPLGAACSFRPPSDRRNVVATEWCDARGEVLQGIVHDENCQVLGGVAGHAGLFGTARAVAEIVESMRVAQTLPAAARDRMWSAAHRVGTYTLGWDTPSGPRSNAGSRMSTTHTVGHLGFTGTSVWVDREAERVVVLLTNRVHPTRENAAIRWLRPAIHDAVAVALDAGRGASRG